MQIKILKICKVTVKLLCLFLLGLLLILSLPYYQTEIYKFLEPIPFKGDFFYNPYKNFLSGSMKANFHAHAAAWLNITDGAQPPAEVYAHYRKNNYDIISLSNYQKITIDTTVAEYVPVYEHGYNVKKRHQLVINAKKVNFFDFPLYQTRHHKQRVIKKLKKDSCLVALAHPEFSGSYSTDDMKYLKGYDFVEVLNHYRTSIEQWDAALTSGNLHWLLADDDTHNINKPGETCVNWTRIGGNVKTKQHVLEALKAGCHYGVSNKGHTDANYLDSCTVRGNQINVYFRNRADTIAFISDNGIVKREVQDSSSASYNITPRDSYVRIEAVNGSSTIFLNPVIRYDGVNLPFNNTFPDVNTFLTILYRATVFIISLIIIFAILLLAGVWRKPLKSKN